MGAERDRRPRNHEPDTPHADSPERTAAPALGRWRVKIDIEVFLPRDAATLPVIRHIAMCALDELGVAPAAVDDVALALTEACTNVVQHSGVDDEYAVHLVVTDAVCEISVVDTGQGFDPSALATGMAPGSAEQGRGLAILSALVDGVRFESRPQAGTVVHLVKRLDVMGDGPLGRHLAGIPTTDDAAYGADDGADDGAEDGADDGADDGAGRNTGGPDHQGREAAAGD